MGNVNSTGNLISAETAEQAFHLVFKPAKAGTTEPTGDVGDVVFDEFCDFVRTRFIDARFLHELSNHFVHGRDFTGPLSDGDVITC